jgi:dolichyl-phosphate-mannose--protein O-mannosyl transferase
MLATGLLLGLALATKWSAVALLGLVGLAVGWRAVILWRDGHRAAAAGALRASVLALVLLPATVYLASWAHYVASGHEPAGLVELHRAMLAYHSGVGVTRSDASPWWAWPLGTGPVRYFASGRRLGGALVVANGNPLLTLPMVPAVAWVAIDWWGRRSRALLVLAIGFFGQWLPWALSPRGTFVYHFLPALPFGCVALAAILVGLWQGGGWRRWAAAAYLAALVAAFAFLYPIHAAVALPPDQVAPRLWLAGWR